MTELSGSTGVGLLILNNKLYCANVGDSECGILTLLKVILLILKIVG